LTLSKVITQQPRLQATGASLDHGCGSRTDTVITANPRLRMVVEVLISYSHSAHAADLRLCHSMAFTSPVRAPRPSAKRPWSLRDRIDECEMAKLITAYRDGATAASLADTHGVSLRSVKRLLQIAGARRTPPHSTSYKETPAATHP
jgi:hypothetical protein